MLQVRAKARQAKWREPLERPRCKPADVFGGLTRNIVSWKRHLKVLSRDAIGSLIACSHSRIIVAPVMMDQQAGVQVVVVVVVELLDETGMCKQH